MNFFTSLFDSNVSIKIDLENEANRKLTSIKTKNGKIVQLPIFVGDEDVAGTVNISLPKGKVVEHIGIKLEFIGEVSQQGDRGNHFEFTSLSTELAPAGSLSGPLSVPFSFPKADKPYESYYGSAVHLRYLLRITISRNYLPAIINARELWVIKYQEEPERNQEIAMEVGIENCIHIKFEYNKSKFHLRDVVIGRVLFHLVRTRIKYMEISLLRKETSGQLPAVHTETDVISKYEIMDGAPIKGEILPVRLFLRQFDLCPTYRNVASKFSVRYYLNLVLFDIEDRRYFKQQEIVLWRRAPKGFTAKGENIEDEEELLETTMTLDQYRNTHKKADSSSSSSSDSSSSTSEDSAEEAKPTPAKDTKEEEPKKEEPKTSTQEQQKTNESPAEKEKEKEKEEPPKSDVQPNEPQEAQQGAKNEEKQEQQQTEQKEEKKEGKQQEGKEAKQAPKKGQKKPGKQNAQRKK